MHKGHKKLLQAALLGLGGVLLVTASLSMLTPRFIAATLSEDGVLQSDTKSQIHTVQQIGVGGGALLTLVGGFLVLSSLLPAKVRDSLGLRWACLKGRMRSQRLLRVARRANAVLTRHPFLLSIAIIMVRFGLFFGLADPRFETNDDAGMMGIAMGSDFSAPTEHLVYINVVIGWALKTLYSWSKSINWYTFFQYLVHAVSMVALLYIFLRQKRPWFGLGAFLAVFVFFELRFLLYLQFTTTAFVAAQSGLLLIVFGGTATKKALKITAGVCLVVLGGLIREHSMYMATLLAVPPFLYTLFRTRSLRVPIFAAVAVAVSIGASAFDDWYYTQNEGWREYSDYNKVLSSLHVGPKIPYDETTKPVFDSIGWSENDLDLFMAWFPADPEVYSKGKLETVLASISG